MNMRDDGKSWRMYNSRRPVRPSSGGDKALVLGDEPLVPNRRLRDASPPDVGSLEGCPRRP
jgi:hypothetical protein